MGHGYTGPLVMAIALEFEMPSTLYRINAITCRQLKLISLIIVLSDHLEIGVLNVKHFSHRLFTENIIHNNYIGLYIGLQKGRKTMKSLTGLIV